MNEPIFQGIILVLGFLGTLVNAFAGLAWWAIRQEVKHVKELLNVKVSNVEAELAMVKRNCGGKC
jgi:hypothetical protein